MDTQQTPNGRYTNWRMSTWRFFAVCLYFAELSFFSTQQKSLVCRVPLFCRVWFLQHSANIFFAECPMECTRQIFWNSANHLFPVVIVYIYLDSRYFFDMWYIYLLAWELLWRHVADVGSDQLLETEKTEKIPLIAFRSGLHDPYFLFWKSSSN